MKNKIDENEQKLEKSNMIDKNYISIKNIIKLYLNCNLIFNFYSNFHQCQLIKS